MPFDKRVYAVTVFFYGCSSRIEVVKILVVIFVSSWPEKRIERRFFEYGEVKACFSVRNTSPVSTYCAITNT